ncbi:hypothetical protein ACOJUR_02165 [Alicyclobacillus tolerans]|uniref:hypothetical protein n=1 Tax=Alicyclobacillus tolerans TaxID=90970 RepID=UPI003B80F157
MNIILHHPAMLTMLWVFLVPIGLTVIFRIVNELRGKFDLEKVATLLTRPILMDIFPLLLLGLLMLADPTHVVILIWYFVAAIAIALRALVELVRQLRQLLS